MCGGGNLGASGGRQRAWNWHCDGDRRLLITPAGRVPRRKRLLRPRAAQVSGGIGPENDDNVDGAGEIFVVVKFADAVGIIGEAEDNYNMAVAELAGVGGQ